MVQILKGLGVDSVQGTMVAVAAAAVEVFIVYFRELEEAISLHAPPGAANTRESLATHLSILHV
jgi:hypothetical protein